MNKMKVNGKNKGNSFERQVSKELSLLLTNNEKDDIIYRSQSSGARYTQRMKVNKDTINQDGDLAPTCSGIGEDFLKVFMVECKFYKSIDLYTLITGSKGGIQEFWNQSLTQVQYTNKVPLLLVKTNYKPILLITDNRGYGLFKNIGMDYILKYKNGADKMYVYDYYKQFLNLDSKQIELMLSICL